jgi:hypothetical protein
VSVPKPRETVTVLRDDLVRVLDYARQFDVGSDDAMQRVTETVLCGPVPVVAPGAAPEGMIMVSAADVETVLAMFSPRTNSEEESARQLREAMEAGE